MSNKSAAHKRIVANNKKATFNYFLEDKFEAGICLLGSEVKSLRHSKVSIEEAYVRNVGSEIFLFNAYIAEFDKAHRFNHDTKRPRKLLLHSKQIKRMIGKVKLEGYTIIPVSIYFNNKNIAKVEIAVARGKKLYDKRETIKQKEWNRNKSRLLRGK